MGSARLWFWVSGLLAAFSLPPVAITGESEQLAQVSGRVVDEIGKPVAGASVWLRSGQPSRLEFRSAITDRGGAFQFADVAPGTATLAALAEGLSWGGIHRHGLMPGQIDNSAVLRLAAPAELRLQITNEEGQPVAGVRPGMISWKAADAPEFWLPSELPQLGGVPTECSGEDGILRLSRLPQGATYSVPLLHPDYARQTCDRVRPEEENPMPVVLERGTRLTVRAVVASTGEPAQGATVRISGGADGPQIFGEPVDEEGRFSVRLPDAEFLTVSIQHPELLARAGSVSIHSFSKYQPKNNLRFELVRRARAQGRVVDSDDRGLPKAHVRLITGRTVAGRALTDERGEYEIEGPEGSVQIDVASAGQCIAAPGQATSVVLDPEQVVRVNDLVAQQLPPARGIVVLSDGQAVARALVSDGAGEAVLTNEAGRFELPLSYDPSFYHVAASHLTERLSGGITFGLDTLLSREELRILLEPESTITGELTGTDGQLRAGVQMHLRGGLKHENWTRVSVLDASRTDEKGRFRFVGLSRRMHYRLGLGDGRKLEPGLANEFVRPKEDNVQVALTISDPVLAGSGAASPPPPAKLADELVCAAWINSQPLSLEALRGQTILLDFWATWCGPCVRELPELQLAHDLFSPRGLVVIGVHHNSVPEEQVREFVREHGLTFPIGVDSASGETCGRYDISAWPTKVLINRRGQVVPLPAGRDLLGILRRQVLYASQKE